MDDGSWEMNRESPSNKKREEMAYVMAVWLLGIFHGFFMVVTLRFRGVLTVPCLLLED